MVIRALNEIDNSSRRDRLINFLPEQQRDLARAKLSTTVLERISEVMELMHGNSSTNRTARITAIKPKASEPIREK